MIVRLATADEYYSAFPVARTPYGSRAFLELNAHKTRALRYFIGFDEDSKPRLGIAMGLGDDGAQWEAPFSAPFAELAYDKPQSAERIYEFISELDDYTGEQFVRITPPPAIYDPVMITRLQAVLANYCKRGCTDYNYHYLLERADDFESHLDRAAAKNYRRAMQTEWEFSAEAPIERAYAVIKSNREAKGYPLAMTLEQVQATARECVQADCFVLSHRGEDVAAAIVYRITSEIVQVIYWGDTPGYSELRPMNALPCYLFKHYRRLGYRIVDIGPSSKHGIPSAGLCRFKESIGCELSLKPTYAF